MTDPSKPPKTPLDRALDTLEAWALKSDNIQDLRHTFWAIGVDADDVGEPITAALVRAAHRFSWNHFDRALGLDPIEATGADSRRAVLEHVRRIRGAIHAKAPEAAPATFAATLLSALEADIARVDADIENEERGGRYAAGLYVERDTLRRVLALTRNLSAKEAT